MADKNYSKTEGTFTTLKAEDRLMLGEKLGLTGCEISVNSYPAGKASAFVHNHKRNEEVYVILEGDGEFMVDEDVFPVEKGCVVRIAPAGNRAIKAGEKGLTYLCIQAEDGSLSGATENDGVLVEMKTAWDK